MKPAFNANFAIPLYLVVGTDPSSITYDGVLANLSEFTDRYLTANVRGSPDHNEWAHCHADPEDDSIPD